MITTLKELEKLLKLCRKQGVTEIALGTVSFKLGDLPHSVSSTGNTVSQTDEFIDPYTGFPDGILTNEQLAFYSAGGDPSEDPENIQ